MRMMNDNLDLSKLQSGKITPEDLPFDLRATVDVVLRFLHPAARTDGLTFRATDTGIGNAPDRQTRFSTALPRPMIPCLVGLAALGWG